MSQISDYVEAMFASLPRTRDVVEMKLQIIQHMEDKFDALLAEGKNENEALGTVISEFGSIDEIKRELGLPDNDGPRPVHAQEQAYAYETMQPAPEPAYAPPQEEELERLLAEYAYFKPKAYLARSIAVGIFILTPFMSDFFDSILLFFVLVAVGVGLLIYFNGRLGDYQSLIRAQRDLYGYPPSREPVPGPDDKKRKTVISSTAWLAAVLVFLCLGFFEDLWHPGWLVFLIVPLVLNVVEIFR